MTVVLNLPVIRNEFYHTLLFSSFIQCSSMATTIIWMIMATCYFFTRYSLLWRHFQPQPRSQDLTPLPRIPTQYCSTSLRLGKLHNVDANQSHYGIDNYFQRHDGLVGVQNASSRVLGLIYCKCEWFSSMRLLVRSNLMKYMRRWLATVLHVTLHSVRETSPACLFQSGFVGRLGIYMYM